MTTEAEQKKKLEYRKKIEPKVQQIANKIEDIKRTSLKHEDYDMDDVKFVVQFLTKQLKDLENQLGKVDKESETFSFD